MSYTENQYGTLTITGDPARFVSTEKVPFGVSMELKPEQDLHGYEYPWPAGGGKNLLNPDIVEIGSYTNIGAETADADNKYRRFKLNLTAGTYTVSSTVNDIRLIRVLANDVVIESSKVIPVFFTLESDAEVKFALRKSDSTPITETIYFQIEAGSTPSAFAPYENICPITGTDYVEFTISGVPYPNDDAVITGPVFDDAIYAGTLTINEDGSGQIVSNKGSVDLGEVTWSYLASVGIFTAYSFVSLYGANPNSVPICSQYKGVAPASSNSVAFSKGNCTTCFLATGDHRLYVRDDAYNDATSFKTAMNGVQLVYELAEPIIIPITCKLQTLKGMNYVWSNVDTPLTITFQYRKEIQPMAMNYDFCWTYPKAYIDKLEARITALETAAAAADDDAKAAPETIMKEMAEPETAETTAEPEATETTEEPVRKTASKTGGK